MTYDYVRRDPAVNVYVAKADETLKALGYTEHSFAHVTQVAERAGDILRVLQFQERTVELGKIAGYLHDIGNVINRVDHSQSGAVMAFRILDRMAFPPEEIATIISAIGNHDEGTGIPVNEVAAALIIADKSDVRRSRVRNAADIRVDIHDRLVCLWAGEDRRLIGRKTANAVCGNSVIDRIDRGDHIIGKQCNIFMFGNIGKQEPCRSGAVKHNRLFVAKESGGFFCNFSLSDDVL